MKRELFSTMSRRQGGSKILTRSNPFILRSNHRLMVRVIVAYLVFVVACTYALVLHVSTATSRSYTGTMELGTLYVKATGTHKLYVPANRSLTMRGSNCTDWTCNHSVTLTPPTGQVPKMWTVDNYTNRFFWEAYPDSGGFVTFKGGEGRELEFRKNPGYIASGCPTSIQRRMSNNRRGRTIFHPELHLMMNSRLLNKSEYERLSPYYQPFGYKYKNKTSFNGYLATLKLFPPQTSIFEFQGNNSRPECLTCAVVSNGGILKGSKQGAEIDKHHMVFRVNRAIRRGYEKDVGSRTTHYVFYDRSLRETNAKDTPKDKGIIYVFVPCRDNDYKYISTVVRGQDPKLKAAAKDVRILHPDFVRYFHKIWVNSPNHSFRPTTGALMLMTALHSGCDQISVYGMGYTSKYSLYYYDKKYARILPNSRTHDIYSEEAILKGLDRAGIISWYKRDVKKFLTTAINSR